MNYPDLEFVKLHGLGNDFIVIDDLSAELELSTHTVASLCDRHFGIGADGVILVRPSSNPECLAYMHYINADGSLAQMCGNGVRCFAKYLVDRGFVLDGKLSLVADTLAGPKPITFSLDGFGCMSTATVDMGQPIFEPEKVPVLAQANAQFEGMDLVKDLAIEAPFGTFAFTCVSMGNPHAVCIIEDFESLEDVCFTNPNNKNLSTLNLDVVGAFFESHELFSEKTNVEFVSVEDDGLAMRVYERGCGETMACGTGACASLVASVICGCSARTNTVKLLGGNLDITWDEQTNHVFMTGPATESFKGTVSI